MVSAPAEPTRSLAILAGLTFVAGVGGMAVSFLFLASRNHLDVIAGAAGFLAGAVLIAAGLLSLTAQSQSPPTNQSVVRLAGCLTGLLPPFVAVLAWPVLHFSAFLMSCLLIPLALLGCAVWAWVVSRSVAGHLCALGGWSDVGTVRGFVFLLQVVAILASWPLFGYLLGLLEAMGYKVGWS